MLKLDFEDLIHQSEEELRERLTSIDEVQFSFVVQGYFGAATDVEIADACFILWYVAERLASHSETSKIAVTETGLEYNAANAEIVMTGFNGPSLATVLYEDLLPAFDPNGEDAPALICDDANDWFEKQDPADLRFPTLEQRYREAASYASDQPDEWDGLQ